LNRTIGDLLAFICDPKIVQI